MVLHCQYLCVCVCLCASCRWCEGHGSGLDGERRYADLTLDFLPGLLWVGRVLDVKQRVVDPREGLPCIFVVAAGCKDHMPETEERREGVEEQLIKNACVALFQTSSNGSSVRRETSLMKSTYEVSGIMGRF